jgi:hypothetical protein
VGSVLAFALIGVLLDAPRTKSQSQTISATEIATQLAGVYHSQLLGEGFDYEPSVNCNQSGALTFTCIASTQTPDAGVLQTTFQVACLAEGSAPGQRCWTDNGEALQ